MLLEPITFDEAWPYINRPAIFYDVKDLPTEAVKVLAESRGMNLLCVRVNGFPVHIVWTFENNLALPMAREWGYWCAKEHRHEWLEVWKTQAKGLIANGVYECFGLCLEKNISQIGAVKKAGGVVFPQFGKFSNRTFVLNVLRLENLFGNNLPIVYSLFDYKTHYGV